MSGLIQRDETGMEIAKAVIGSIKHFKGKKLFFDPENEVDQATQFFELSMPNLNYIISGSYFGPRSGFAWGKIYNFYGTESIGKSALALQIAGEVYRAGGRILLVDGESTANIDDYFRMYGIDGNDTERVHFVSLDSMEDATDVINAYVEANSIDLYIVDSMTGLGTQLINDQEGSANSMGAMARRVSQHFAKLQSKVGKVAVSGIYINQLRNVKKGMYFVEDSTGGNSMKFATHVGLRMKYVEKPKDDKGHKAIIKAVKNKVATPQREAEFLFVPGKGFDSAYDKVSVAANFDVVKVAGSWVSASNEDGTEIFKMQGFDRAVDYLRENPDVLNALWERTKEIIGS